MEEQDQTEQEVTSVEQAQPSQQEINWKAANEAMRLQRQRIEELEQRLQSTPKEEPDEFDSLDQEDYLTVGNARKLAEKLAEKKAKVAAQQIVAEYAAQQSVVQDEANMRSKHDDYDYVIDNFVLPQLKNDPALAHKIRQSKNPAQTAYKLGLLSDGYEESKQKQISPKAERILKNTSRPLPGTAVGGDSMKSQGESMANMSKEDFWKLSQQYASKAY